MSQEDPSQRAGWTSQFLDQPVCSQIAGRVALLTNQLVGRVEQPANQAELASLLCQHKLTNKLAGRAEQSINQAVMASLMCQLTVAECIAGQEAFSANHLVDRAKPTINCCKYAMFKNVNF